MRTNCVLDKAALVRFYFKLSGLPRRVYPAQPNGQKPPPAATRYGLARILATAASATLTLGDCRDR